MKIKDYKKAYEGFSDKLSEITRYLSFMGFGVIWILIGGLDGFNQSFIPPLLKWVLALLVLFQIFDILHYLYQTITWYNHFKRLENEHGTTCKRDDFAAPDKYANRAWCIYWAKIAIVIAAFILLLIYIIGIIF